MAAWPVPLPEGLLRVVFGQKRPGKPVWAEHSAQPKSSREILREKSAPVVPGEEEHLAQYGSYAKPDLARSLDSY